ncbi:MAG: hypothetical protein LLG00_02045, partial [Planctomycetaceae bacterium]|nr:hypothetical protein [Planctomycetaceae bacterium]
KGDLARAWHLEFASQTPATIRLVHRASVQLLSNTILLVTAAIGCWLVGRRLAIIVSMLGVFAALAILLPAVWAPLATGGVLGTIFCLLWRWIRIVAAKSAAKSASGRANEDDRRSWSGKNSDSTVSMAWPTGLLVLAALWLLPVCGEARDGAPSSKTAARGETPSAVSNEPSALAGAARSLAPEVGDDDRGKGEGELAVLVPIDAQRRPAGDKLYVPEPLYLELHRRAAAAQRPPEWIIVGANYKGELVRERSSGRYSLGSLQAEYDLRVFDAGARVQLPLDAAAVRSGGLLVDGQPVEAESREGMRWDSGKTVSGRPSGISIIVAEPGRHRLQVSLWPTICESGASGGFELPAPKAPSARLEMRLPSDAPMLDIPGAIGGFRTATPTGGRDSFFGQSSPVHVVTADLGQTDRLAVRWTKSASSVSRGQATVRADQMLWLRVHPGSVAIAAKFKLHAAGGDVDRVQLAVDPRLRLLPLSGQQRPTVKVDEETSQRRLISFCWPHPIAGETTLEATFLMSGASGVGNASLPLIDLIDAQLSKRWMAVSVDAALDHRERHCEDLAKVRVGDFLTAWEGTESVRPLAAYSIPAGPIRWTLSTRPHEAHCTVDQAVNFGFDTENVDVVFDGRISVAAGYVFEHRLTAPRELKVERVSVLEGDIERALRWAQDDDGITVFLSGPASGVQKLTIRGRMPLRCGNADKWTIPAMRLQKCEVLSAAMRFFEHPGMLVNVESAKGDSAWRMPDKAAAESALGRPVATVGWDGVGPAPMAVTVKPQRSRAATTMAAAGKRNSGDAAIVSGANQPSLSGRPSDRDPFFPRVVAAAATLLCILAAVIVDRRGWLTAIRRRPYAAGVALGLVWWLWLSPSALGLMIAMACIVGAMVGGLRARLRPGLRA